MNEKRLAEVVEKLERALGDEYTVDIGCYTKNNGVKLTGICVCKSGERIGKIFYLNEVLCDPLKTVDKIVVDITHECLVTGNETKQVDNMASQILDFERVQQFIFPRLISKKYNSEILQTHPYKDFLDLAVVCVCEMNISGEGVISCKIDQELLDVWGMTFDDIYVMAISNIESNENFYCRRLEDIITTISMQPPLYVPDINIYVVSNECGVNGARCMINSKVIKYLSNEFNGSFIILPSSIHEILVIPTNELYFDLDTFSDLVREVNNSDALNIVDILSDHAYLYDSETGWKW